MKILIIDPNPQHAALVADVLALSCTVEGHKFFHVNTLEAAIDAIVDCDIDLVIIEPQFPGYGGMALIKTIKDYRPSVPIAAFSQCEDRPCPPGCRKQCIEYGATWNFDKAKELEEVARLVNLIA